MLMLLRKEEDLIGRRVNLTVDGEIAGGAVERGHAHQLGALCEVKSAKRKLGFGVGGNLPSVIGSSRADSGAAVGSSFSSDTWILRAFLFANMMAVICVWLCGDVIWESCGL